MMTTSAVTLRRYRSVCDRPVSWTDPFGRKITLQAGRGGHFPPCPELAQLIRQGLVVEPTDMRLARVELPNSTERQVPA